MHTLPPGLGALIILIALKGIVYIVSRCLVGEITLYFRCKVKILRLFCPAVEYSEDMIHRQIHLRPSGRDDCRLAVIKPVHEQSGSLFDSGKQTIVPGYVIPEEQTVHYVIV